MRQKTRQQRPHFAEVSANFNCNLTIVGGTYSFLAPGVQPEVGKPGVLRYRIDLVFRDGQWQVAQHQTSYPTQQSEHTVKVGAGSVKRRASAAVPTNSRSAGGDAGAYKAGGWSNGQPTF